MATNTWIGQYYVDGSGKWVPNKQKNLKTGDRFAIHQPESDFSGNVGR